MGKAERVRDPKETNKKVKNAEEDEGGEGSVGALMIVKYANCGRRAKRREGGR